MWIDAPASVFVVSLSYNFDHPLILFGILGTAWWCLLSVAAALLFGRISKLLERS
jgi:hypothetical protein